MLVCYQKQVTLKWWWTPFHDHIWIWSLKSTMTLSFCCLITAHNASPELHFSLSFLSSQIFAINETISNPSLFLLFLWAKWDFLVQILKREMYVHLAWMQYKKLTTLTQSQKKEFLLIVLVEVFFIFQDYLCKQF